MVVRVIRALATHTVRAAVGENRLRGMLGVTLFALMLGDALAQAPTTQPASTQPAATQPASTQPATTQPVRQPAAEGRRVAYAPHVTIDWSVPQVEIDARVVLREGPLELLVCAEQTKEHESILVTAARPRRVYEALGLIGLEPGHPLRYDSTTAQYTPATGQRLALEIHYRDGEEDKTVAAHEWMAASGTQQSISAPVWVFCGSQTLDGKFAADVEGTVACVVDFNSALIGLAERHSAKNSELWLVANTPLIPERGTPCRLVVRGLNIEPLVLTLTPEGFFLWKDEILDPLELDAVIRWRTRHHPSQRVELSPMAVEPSEVKRMNLFARVAGRAIIGSGIAPQSMTLDLLEEPAEEAIDFTPASSPAEETSATQPAQGAPTTQPATTPKPGTGETPSTKPVKGESP